LKKFGLPRDIVDKNWFQFRKHLLSVIIDCPLLHPEPSIVKFSFVRTLGFQDWTGKYSINYKKEFKDRTIQERGVLLGDWDEETKKEVAENQDRFEYHYKRKAFLRLMGRARQLEGKGKKEIEKRAERIHNDLEKYQRKYGWR
ncbi:hypothetical protein C4587_02225, partial [Candidatus Parcubacteria bacterium]